MSRAIAVSGPENDRRRIALVAAAAGLTAPIAALNVYGALSAGFARPEITDVAVYYGAASIGLRFGWQHLYEPSKQAVVWPALHIYQTTWVQTPPVAWLFAPLTALPLAVAYEIWAPLMLLMIGLTWWLLAVGGARARFAQLAAVLALWAVGIGIASGQLVFLVGACVAVTWWLLKRDHPVIAGLPLVLAFALKPQSASLVPFALLIAGYRRTFAAWAVGAALAGVAVLFVLGPEGTMSFVQRLREASSRPSDWNAVPGMTFAGILGAGLLASALQLAGAAASLSVAWRTRARGSEIPIASGIVGSHLLTPYLHEPEIFMLVVAAWLYVRTQPQSTRALYPVAMWIAAEIAHIPSVGYAPLLVLEVLWLGLMFGMPGHVPSLPAASPSTSRPESPTTPTPAISAPR
jgi:hypothetical protein